MPVAVSNRQRAVWVSAPRLRRAGERALAAVGRASEELSLTLVDDREIRRLNRRYRRAHRRTDVLAFPLDPPLVGEVVISAETARRQAGLLRVPVALELDLLVTHGVLHLAGYDDHEPIDAMRMHEREREILAGAASSIPARLWTGLLPA